MDTQRRRRWRKRRDKCTDTLSCADCGCDLLDCGPSMLSFWLLGAWLLLVGAFRPVGREEYRARPGLRGWPSRRIRSYQLHVSGGRFAGTCNLSPSCSQFGLDAFDAHPPRTAARLTRARLRECSDAGRQARSVSPRAPRAAGPATPAPR